LKAASQLFQSVRTPTAKGGSQNVEEVCRSFSPKILGPVI